MLARPAPSYSHSYDASLMERLLFKVAKRWVAGYNADEAIDVALDTNSHGMSAILNFLGEDTTDSKLVDMTVNEYLLLMDLMHARKVQGCVSIKSTEDTIAIYLDLYKQYDMVGIAIQSYLRRSASDLLHIIECGGKVRLVKGAYHESEEHIFVTNEEVNASYSKLMKMLFDSKNYFAI